MQHRRIVRGNFTTLPSGADVLSIGATNAVTERKDPLTKSKVPHPTRESVGEARRFSMEHET